MLESSGRRRAHLCEPDVVEFRQGHFQRFGAQPLSDRRVREPPRRVGAGSSHWEALLRGPLEKRPQEVRFADARFTRYAYSLDAPSNAAPG